MYNFRYPGKQKHAPKHLDLMQPATTARMEKLGFTNMIYYFPFATLVFHSFDLSFLSYQAKAELRTRSKKGVQHILCIYLLIFTIKHSNSLHVIEGIEPVCHVQPATHATRISVKITIFTFSPLSFFVALLKRRLIVELQFVT